MTDPLRETSLRRAFLAPRRPVVAGLALRPFTLWTLDFCDELGLSYFTAPKQTADPSALPLNDREQLAALIWGHLDEVDETAIDGHLFAGTWPAEVKRVHRDPRIGPASPEISSYIGYVAGLIAAATVKIKPRKSKGAKPEKTPPDLLHPAGRTALIWTVGGGQIQSEAQHRYLYRELPLPVLLQYYHAACREAQLLTVAAGRKTDPKRVEATQARIQAAKKTAPPVDYF